MRNIAAFTPTEPDKDEDEETVAEEERPWRDMLKGRRPRQLSLAQEQALIARHQTKDRRAAELLLGDYDLFVRNLAHKIARLTGAYKVEDDMAQVARMVLYEKMSSYDLGSKARLSSYAFRKILQCMNKIACESLESTRLPRDAVTYAAHRDLEQGMGADEVGEKHKICPEAVNSLQRTTLPLEAVENIDLEGLGAPAPPADPERRRALEHAWAQLSALERILLGLFRVGEVEAQRAKMLGVSKYELGLMERVAIRRLDTLMNLSVGASF